MGDSLLFAAAADDDTGASDLAGMRADQGVRVLLVLDRVLLEADTRWAPQPQALVLATAIRATPREQAFAATADALRRVAALTPRTIQVKYCSTLTPPRPVISVRQ